MPSAEAPTWWADVQQEREDLAGPGRRPAEDWLGGDIDFVPRPRMTRPAAAAAPPPRPPARPPAAAIRRRLPAGDREIELERPPAAVELERRPAAGLGRRAPAAADFF